MHEIALRPPRSFPVLAYLLIIIAAALAGVAVVSILPPFEGFDETAHWSTLQQISDTGRSPTYGVDTISTDLGRYRGPTPYDAPGAILPVMTYKGFRLAGEPPLAMKPGSYGRGGFRNWEAQHPPLYYRALAPLYFATKSLLLKTQLLALRLASWILAVIGLLIAAEGSRRYIADGAKVAMAIVAWPFIVPEFLPEMARVGNDSLCLLLTGCSWSALMRLLSPRGGWGSALALGTLLGLGLLTKALFLPIVAGTGALLALRWLLDRNARRAGETITMICAAAAIGLWWYIARHAATGSFSGSDEFIQFQKQGGFLANLLAHFSAFQLLVGLNSIVVGFLWGGTWSLAQPHTTLLLGPALLLAVPMIGWLLSWRRMDWSDLAAIFWMVPLAGSLLYHVLMLIAFSGSGAGTPGHYLHIVAPAFALALVRGWRWKWVGFFMAVWTALFTVYVWCQELALFSGCASKNPVTNHYMFDQGCFIDGHSLTVLAHPAAAVCAIILSLAGLLAASFMLLNRLRSFRMHPLAELTPIN